MGFLPPFILGILAGGIVVWQLYKRQGQSEDSEIAGGETSLSVVVDSTQQESTQEAKDTTIDEGDQPESGESGAPPVYKADQLQKIYGIGPVYAQRLSSAGIQTFAQLAELGPEQINEIVSRGQEERLIDAENWISQAREFAQSNEQPTN